MERRAGLTVDCFQHFNFVFGIQDFGNELFVDLVTITLYPKQVLPDRISHKHVMVEPCSRKVDLLEEAFFPCVGDFHWLILKEAALQGFDPRSLGSKPSIIASILEGSTDRRKSDKTLSLP